jgi:hypothetical protein
MPARVSHAGGHGVAQGAGQVVWLRGRGGRFGGFCQLLV